MPQRRQGRSPCILLILDRMTLMRPRNHRMRPLHLHSPRRLHPPPPAPQPPAPRPPAPPAATVPQGRRAALPCANAVCAQPALPQHVQAPGYPRSRPQPLKRSSGLSGPPSPPAKRARWDARQRQSPAQRQRSVALKRQTSLSGCSVSLQPSQQQPQQPVQHRSSSPAAFGGGVCADVQTANCQPQPACKKRKLDPG